MLSSLASTLRAAATPRRFAAATSPMDDRPAQSKKGGQKRPRQPDHPERPGRMSGRTHAAEAKSNSRSKVYPSPRRKENLTTPPTKAKGKLNQGVQLFMLFEIVCEGISSKHVMVTTPRHSQVPCRRLCCMRRLVHGSDAWGNRHGPRSHGMKV